MTDIIRFSHFSHDYRNLTGPGEQHLSSYTYVFEYRNWRRYLDVTDTEEFTYREKKFKSILHAIQYEKIRLFKSQTHQADLFTVDSQSPQGTSDGLVILRSYPVKLNKTQEQEWKIMYERGLLMEISLCKFKQCQRAKEILLATNQAQLWHANKKGGYRCTYLEMVRDELMRDQDTEHHAVRDRDTE